MAWHSYTSVPNIISADDVNNIYENMDYIKTLLSSYGISISTLSTIAAANNINYADVAILYTNTESNLDKISDNECQSIYYIAPVTRGMFEPSRPEWQRWIDCLNDMYDILVNGKGKWQYLLCTDGYPQINGKYILCRGETIND